MSAASAILDPNPARTRLRVATLDQWAAAGLALAETVMAESGRSLVDVARTLYRISQAVRLAIALAMRLSDPDDLGFRLVPAKARAPRAAEPEARAETPRIQGKPVERPEREPQFGFSDRELADDAILRRPLKDIVKVICRALGVTPDWSLWSDEDAPADPATAPQPDRPVPVVAPPPDSVRAIPKPPPRPSLILDRPTKPPPIERLRTRLMGSSAAGALLPTFPPLAPWRADASACPGVAEAPLRSADVLARPFARHITNAP